MHLSGRSSELWAWSVLKYVLLNRDAQCER